MQKKCSDAQGSCAALVSMGDMPCGADVPEKNKQDTKLGTVLTSQYSVMHARVEQLLKRSLKDREAPSKALVASKLEQVEEGAPVAEDLRDVTSYEDVGEAHSAVINPTSAMLRIRPGRASALPPSTPEERR